MQVRVIGVRGHHHAAPSTSLPGPSLRVHPLQPEPSRPEPCSRPRATSVSSGTSGGTRGAFGHAGRSSAVMSDGQDGYDTVTKPIEGSEHGYQQTDAGGEAECSKGRDRGETAEVAGEHAQIHQDGT